MSPTPRIAIAAGGTRGHRHIGLAIAEGLSQLLPGAQITIITNPDPEGPGIGTASPYPTRRVASSQFTAQTWGKRAHSLWQLGAGVLDMRRWLKEQSVAAVIGCGGHASTAAVLAAVSLGIPTLLHEANAIPGRANRFLAPYADRVCVSWPQALEQFDGAKVTGTPVRRGIAAAVPLESAPLDAPLLLVLGGSMGSEELNDLVPDLAGRLHSQGQPLLVTHQCGDLDTVPVRRRYSRHGLPADVVNFLPDACAAMSRARVAVSSSGAATMAELARLGVPTLLVPLGQSVDDHQRANARAFSELSGCDWLDSGHWDEDRAGIVLARLLGDDERWLSAREGMRCADEGDAAAAVARECADLLGISPP